MITDHTLRIRPVANRPRAWEITIDGTDVAGLVTAFTLRATAASLRPTVELELVAYNGLGATLTPSWPRHPRRQPARKVNP